MDQGLSKLEELREEIVRRRLNRRDVLKRAMAMGLSAPIIAGLLAACGGEDEDEAEDAGAESTGTLGPVTGTPEGGGPTPATDTFATPLATGTIEVDASPDAEGSPTQTGSGSQPETEPGQGRGVGDLVRILYWQAPTILNPHFSQGDKDSSAASVVLEPLLNHAPDGSLVPRLAAAVPSLEDGSVAADGMSVTYTLRDDVLWSDGEPFTAEDVKFTYDWVMAEGSSVTTLATYQVIESIDVVDEHTVTINFNQPNPEWFGPFSTGYGGHVLPRHILEEYMGPAARDAPFNLNPIGTGPYKVVDFRPGDVVIYDINENYRDDTRPYFQQVELKGGGDATAAARAAIQSGETDYGWNLQVEKAVLEQIAAEGDFGELLIIPGNSVERILVNFADPNTEVDGARSEPSTQHPFLSEKPVREAFAMSTDRDTIAGELYGPSGEATTNILVSPDAFVSPNTTHTFDIEGASALLEEAGWTGSPRAKDGVQMSVVFQTTINPVRQKTQEIVKQAWEEMGVPTELKSIDAGVYFSSDAGNPDTAGHFYADFEMFTNGPSSPYPIAYMAGWKSDEPETDLAQKSNQWSGSNYNRWVNDEYNQLYREAESELDPERQAELFIAMNDLVINEIVDIPLVHRAQVSAKATKLQGITRSPWEPETYDVGDWYFEE